jgi:hypothetical protein
MLMLGDPPQNPFSTASVISGQNRPALQCVQHRRQIWTPRGVDLFLAWNLTADQAAPLWQAVQAQAVIHL